MIVIPFRREHLDMIDVQPAQAYWRPYIEANDVSALEQHQSFTCVEGDKILMCFGWIEIYPTRAAVWALISGTCGKHFVGMTRIAKRLISGLPYKRVEIDVDCEFEQGHRWAKMLGFSLEAERLRGHRIDGGDCAIYAKVRP